MSFQQEFNKILGTVAATQFAGSQTKIGKAKKEFSAAQDLLSQQEASGEASVQALQKQASKTVKSGQKLQELAANSKVADEVAAAEGKLQKYNEQIKGLTEDKQTDKDLQYLKRLDSMLGRQEQVENSRKQIKAMTDRIEQGKVLGQEIEAAEKLLQAKKAEEPKKEEPKKEEPKKEEPKKEEPKKEAAPAEKKEEPKKEEPKPTPSPSEPVAVRRTEVRARSFAEAEQKLKEIDAKGGKS